MNIFIIKYNNKYNNISFTNIKYIKYLIIMIKSC